MNYYHFIRREIEPLLTKSPSRILDVGAGSGMTLKWLKSRFPSAETTGVELNEDMCGELRRNADIAIIAPIDACIHELKTYDLILLLDVLEHVPNAESVLQALSNLLTPGGQVIVSVPNIAHLSVSVPLLFKRRFTYRDAGILDRTHLRFFVEDTAVKLMNDCNLTVKKGLVSGLAGPKAKLIDSLSVGMLRHYLTKQYIMLAERSEAAGRQPKIHWQIPRVSSFE